VGNRRRVSTRTQASAAKVRQLVLDTLPKPLSGQGNETIFGPGGVLDSLDLVNFLADLEYRLDESFERKIVLASERAMSQHRSPFRDVDSLTAYISELLAE